MHKCIGDFILRVLGPNNTIIGVSDFHFTDAMQYLVCYLTHILPPQNIASPSLWFAIQRCRIYHQFPVYFISSGKMYDYDITMLPTCVFWLNFWTVCQTFNNYARCNVRLHLTPQFPAIYWQMYELSNNIVCKWTTTNKLRDYKTYFKAGRIYTCPTSS